MHKELEEKYRKLCKALDGFSFHSINTVNHKPHPFTIGPKHIAYAADHCGGMLGTDVCKKAPCAHKGCRLSYEQHTHDTVMFLSLKRNVSNSDAVDQLKQLAAAGMDEDGIDGVAFVKNNFQVEQ